MMDVGGIVGTGPLALQVLQGLNWYYSRFRFYNDIKCVVNRIELIEDNLQLLDNAVQRLRPEDNAIWAGVRTNIAACNVAVGRLQEYQTKCGEPDDDADTLERMARYVKNRTKWPFRKNTLEDLQTEWDRLEGSLQIIGQTLNLDTLVWLHNDANRRAVTLGNEVGLVGSRQIYQTDLLEVVHQRSEEHLTRFQGMSRA